MTPLHQRVQDALSVIGLLTVVALPGVVLFVLVATRT